MTTSTASTAIAPTITVCLKWVGLRPDIDRLTGEVSDDDRFSGWSAADRTALEVGLRLADDLGGVVAVATVGPDAADRALREVLAVGASRVTRLDPGDNDQPDSDEVAAALATVCAGSALVVCGDYSLDRGTGSVPAFLAHALGVAQALGVTSVETVDSSSAQFRVVRRLDQGRREILDLTGPAVVSVEPSLELRRAGLSSMLATVGGAIEIVDIELEPSRVRPSSVAPLRPRSQVVEAPAGETRDRILKLSGANVERTPPTRIEVDGERGADVIIDHLRQWGYLEP